MMSPIHNSSTLVCTYIQSFFCSVLLSDLFIYMALFVYFIIVLVGDESPMPRLLGILLLLLGKIYPWLSCPLLLRINSKHDTTTLGHENN